MSFDSGSRRTAFKSILITCAVVLAGAAAGATLSCFDKAVDKPKYVDRVDDGTGRYIQR